MVFSSNLFLFGFLPIALASYHVTPKRWQNHALFVLSSLFYIWGGGLMILLLYSYIGVNFYVGRLIHRRREQGLEPRVAFMLGIAFNLLLLSYFKYAGFLSHEIERVFASWNLQLDAFHGIPLPVGISFFCFQAVSYLVEVYRGQDRPQARLVDFGLFLACFPHLVAGPVVRYSEISDELRDRKTSIALGYEGFLRFSVGLGKKVLLANPMGALADQVFGLPNAELSTPLAWLGIVAYSFQIYFDFSGYSDMAIGLARFFGFHFPENFNHPYRASSVTDFWRRWHMTLSRWFRDFLYIPLGGNQKGPVRTYGNLFLVFLLCGLWHGASWTFAVWGLYHGVLLVIERLLKDHGGYEPSGLAGTVYTFSMVTIGWVFFRSDDIGFGFHYLGLLFGQGAGDVSASLYPLRYYLQNDRIVYLVVAAFLSFVPYERLLEGVAQASSGARIAQGTGAMALVLLASLYLSTSGFNPFIYFRF